MIRIGLKGLWAHKRRLAGTFLAVLLGASFLSGTLVLGDTLESNFTGLFTDANAGTDVIVRSEAVFDSTSDEPSSRDRWFVDASIVEEIRGVEGVAAAEPQIEGYGQLIGDDGEPVGTAGPPRTAGNWIEEPELNPYHLVEGRAPRADDEVVINRGAAEDGDTLEASPGCSPTRTPAPTSSCGASRCSTRPRTSRARAIDGSSTPPWPRRSARSMAWRRRSPRSRATVS